MNRYEYISSVPQPVRKILPAATDIIHTLKMGERIDNLAQKYYNDPTAAFIIMYGNPEFDNEFEIPVGAKIRIPYPLSRVTRDWNINKEI